MMLRSRRAKLGPRASAMLFSWGQCQIAASIYNVTRVADTEQNAIDLAKEAK